MDRWRYWVGILLVLTLPPGVSFWIVVHPFASAWRRRGPTVTYVATFAFMFAVMFALWPWRARLVGRDLGWNPWLAGFGIALYTVAVAIEVACRKHLKWRTLIGVPELSTRASGRLLTEGIYGRVRHPRYLGLYVGVTGWCLVVHHVGVYVVMAATFVALYLVILLEERELVARFGDEYERYRASVPRLIPRRRRAETRDDR